MSAESNVVTAEGGGFTITSNTSTAETLDGILNPPKEGAQDEPADLSKAASELGKAGGKAAAEKRQKAKEEALEAEKKAAPKQEAEPEEEPEPAAAQTDDEKTGKPRHDPKARMLEATRKEAEAKREAKAERERREALEREIEALRRERAPQPEKETAQAAPTDDDPEPQEGDFESYPEFVKAAARWAARDERRQLEAKNAQQSEADRKRNEIKGSLEALTKAVADARTDDPEFVKKVSKDVAAVDPTFVCVATGVRPDGRAWIADEFLSAPENAPTLMLYLSEHPDEFQRISALSSPRAVTRALAMIVAKQGTEAATADTSSKPEVSKAPPPVRSVTGAPSTVPVGGYRPGMDFDAWLKANPRKVAR